MTGIRTSEIHFKVHFKNLKPASNPSLMGHCLAYLSRTSYVQNESLKKKQTKKIPSSHLIIHVENRDVWYALERHLYESQVPAGLTQKSSTGGSTANHSHLEPRRGRHKKEVQTRAGKNRKKKQNSHQGGITRITLV